MRWSVARILQKSGGDPPIEHPLSTHPALIRRWSGKFSSQLKFAGWSADSWGNYTICRRPPGCRPNIWRWPVGHRPIFLGKIMPKIGRSPPGHRGIIPRWSHGDRTVTQGWSAISLDKESHLTVTARPPAGIRRETAGHVNIISCDFHLERLVGCNENNNGL